jgi:DNA-binding response OmpR family regulator
VTSERIFLLEDDKDFATAVEDSLSKHGFDVSVFHLPHQFFYEVKKSCPSLAIIDWMLPEMNGIDVVRGLRQLQSTRLAIIMLTQMDSAEHIVNALDVGADDYLVKPEHGRVLLARVNAVLRRYYPQATEAILSIKRTPFRLEFGSRETFVGEVAVALAPREFDLVWTLFLNPGRLFSRSELLAAVWGKHEDPGEHTLTQHIYAVRKKMALAEHGYRIVPVYGTGYRLELPHNEK